MGVPELRGPDSRAIRRLHCGVKGEGTGPKLRKLLLVVLPWTDLGASWRSVTPLQNEADRPALSSNSALE